MTLADQDPAGGLEEPGATRWYEVRLSYAAARRALRLARVYETEGGRDDDRRAACLARVVELREAIRALRAPDEEARPGLARARALAPGLAAASEREPAPRARARG